MTETEVYDKLTLIFREFFDDPALVLRPEMSPRDIDGWDSAKTVTILLEIEESFGFEMSSDEIDGLRCVADFATVILSRTGGSLARP
jgi:acyl carrier protein